MSEEKKTYPESTFAGFPGGAFNVRGEGFGTARGSIKMGDMPLEVTAWNDTVIKGTVPANAKMGDVQLVVGDRKETIKQQTAEQKLKPIDVVHVAAHSAEVAHQAPAGTHTAKS